MNRNSKHPGRAYKRGPSTGDKTRNSRAYRVTASWDQRPDRPAIRYSSDRHAALRIAREYAEQGAYVIVEQHRGHGDWRTVREFDGPALLAEQQATERAEAERAARERRFDAEFAAQADQNARAHAVDAARALDCAARLMVRPPVARDTAGRATARHITGAQR